MNWDGIDTAGSFSPRWRWLLLSFSGIILLTRMHSFRYPANVDVSVGQVIGHELLQGKLLYTDLWDVRPPLTYVGYAAAELIVGWGDAQVLFIGVLLAVITLLGVWYAAARVSPAAGVIAAAFWVILQADTATEAHHPNGEAFVNAAVVWALALIVRGRARWGPAVLWAAASLMKLNVIAFPAVFAFAHVSSSSVRRRALVDVAVWLAVGAGAWLLTIGWFAAQGRLQDFVAAVFVYSSYYDGSTSVNVIRGLVLWNVFHPVMFGAASAAGLTFLLFLLKAPQPQRELMAGALIAAWFAVLIPGKFYYHYYQLYLPILAVGAGWGAAALLARTPRVGLAAAAGGLLFAIAAQAPAYFTSGEEWVQRAMREDADRYLAQMKTVPVLLRELPAGGGLFQIGSQTYYHIAAQRPPAAGVYFLKHMCRDGDGPGNPLADRLTTAALTALANNPPAMIVRDSAYASWCSPHPVLDWVDERYVYRNDLTVSSRAQLLTRRGAQQQ